MPRSARSCSAISVTNQGFRPTPPRSDLGCPAGGMAGSGRHSFIQTTPGSTRLKPTKKRWISGSERTCNWSRCLAVDAGHAAYDVTGVIFRGAGGATADGQEPPDHLVAVLGDDRMRVCFIRDEIQELAHTNASGWPDQASREVAGSAGPRPARADRRAPLRPARRGRAAPDHGPDHRVVVDIDHARVRSDLLGHLVHVGLGGKTAAKVDELPDTCFLSEKADRPADERPVIADDSRHVRRGRDKLLGRLAVDGEVVLAAEQVIVNPGDIRPRGINAT